MKKLLNTLLFIAGTITALIAQKEPTNLFPFDGNADDKLSTISGTVTGASLTKGRRLEDNTAYSFDGVDDKISFGDVLDMSTNDFTISVWANISTFKGLKPGTGSSGGYILTKGLSIFTSPSRAGFGIKARELDGENTLEFLVGANNAITRVSATGFKTDTWYYITAVRSTDKIFFYVDGKLVGENNIKTTDNLNTNSALQLGSSDRLGNDPNGATFFHGKVDQLAIYNTALTQTEIETIFTGATCKVLTKHTFSDLIDETTNKHDGTASGTVLTTDRNGDANQAYSFDGVDDKISFGDVLDMSTNDFTISVWANVSTFKGLKPGTGSSGGYILTKGLSIFTSPSRAGFGIKARELDGDNVFEFLTGANNAITRVSAGGFKANTWYHITAVRATDKIYLYVNGKLVGENSIEATANLNTNSALQLGQSDRLGNDPNGATFLHGKVDELTIYNCAKNVQEILVDYTNTSSNVVTNIAEEVNTQNLTSVYPNPVSDYLFIENNDVVEVVVYNIQGQVVISTKETKIDFSALKSGIYTVKLISNTKIENIKVIKQ